MRRTTLYVVAVLGLLTACALATVLVAAHEREAAATARDRHADRAVGRLQAELTSAEEALRGIEALFTASEEVTPAEFAAYTRHLLVPAGLERLSYAEFVPGRDRRSWERRTGLTIRTLGPAGLRPAPPRPAYLPVRFLRGRQSRGLLGWDMSSEPVRAAALAAARSARAARVTAPVRLIAPDRPGVLLVLPVHRGDRGPDAEAQGFVVGGYRVDVLGRQATAHLPEGTLMRITDGAQVLAGPAEPLRDATRRDVRVAGRTWTVEVTGGPGASWASPAGVGGAGIALTTLLALLFRQAVRRERYALELIDARLRERDAAERRLRASEEAFRMLAEGSTDMISLHWPDGRYVYVSPSSGELVGYTPDELAGRSPRDFLHPDDVARLEREAPDEDEAGVVTTSFRFRHRDGHYTWLEATERLIRDEEGRVLEVRAAARCIDARVQAEVALREREERIRSLVQSASDAIVMADGESRIISWNEAATRIFGHAAEEALGRSLGIIMPERYRAGHARAFAAVAAGAETRLMGQVIELEGLRADGTEFPLELTLGTWQSDGRRYFAGVIRDVSARKAEEAERQGDERFRRALLGSLSEGVAACDADGRLVFFNDARRHLHAFDDHLPETLEDWAGRRTLFHPDGVTPLRADEMPLARVLAGETVREQTVVTLVGGVRRTLLVAGQPILDDDRRPIGAVTAAHDVTERIETQARLEHTTRQLESILDAVGEGVYGLDPEGRVTFANPAAAAMLGWDVDELLGQSQHGLVHPSGHEGRSPDERSQIWSVLEDGASRRVEDELFWRRDGHCFPVSYVTSPLRDRGRLVGAVVTFQDISERRAVERMKDEFVSMVSHELRTPLTSIRGALNILADGGDLSPAAERRMLEIACANTERLVRLVNDILDLERIESGEELQLGSWCARGLVADAVALIAPLAEERRVSITTAAPDAAMAVDPHRIIQVLTNLLGNAIKFSPAGGRVSVGGHVAGDEVVVTIADEGRGIPADKLETIFERFQQVDASDARQAGGTGLGLAICRRIASLHGGRVWAESRPGEGSVFHLALPLSDAPAESPSLPFLEAAV